MKRREWRLLLMLPLAMLLIGLAIDFLTGYTKMLPHGPLEPVIEEPTLPAMSGPRLGDAPPLPERQAIAAEVPTLRELLADRATVRHEDVLDALTLAWGEELLTADRQASPIPQRVLARDLLLGGVAPGAAITIHGRLLDSVPAPVPGSPAGSTGYQRLAIQLDEQQIAQVLAPDSAGDLIIGRNISLVGRFLGSAGVPSGISGETQMPLLMARSVRVSEQTTDTGDDDLAEMRGLLPKEFPADLYDNVGDERSILETRPYYFLLGQANLDRDSGAALFAGAASGNLRADDIHQQPDRSRGQPLVITGYVYRGWEDSNVARDQPFGVHRVLRILLWNRDFGQVTESVDGKPTIKNQILRLYEVCLVTDQPLPERGAKIIVPSRFFKFRAIPVTPNSLRDKRNGVQRQSDNVYTFVFVGSSYTYEPPPPKYTISALDIVVSILCIGVGILMFVLVRRDQRLEGLVGAQVRRFRDTRKRLANERTLTAKTTAKTTDETTAPGDATPPAPESSAEPSGPTVHPS
jgi:hypothetical protein